MAHADTVMADALKDYVNSPSTSVTAIAEKHGVSPSTLTVWAKKAKVKLRGRGRERQRQPSARTREILELTETLTLEDVGARFGMSKQRVGKIVKRWKDWQKPRQSPFVTDDVVKWKGNLYKVIEGGVLFGKVMDQTGQVVHNFYWNMAGSLAVKVDPALWTLKIKPPQKRAA
jgi:transposase-like protein